MTELSPELKEWLADRATAIEQLEGVLAEELMKRDSQITELRAQTVQLRERIEESDAEICKQDRRIAALEASLRDFITKTDLDRSNDRWPFDGYLAFRGSVQALLNSPDKP